MDKGNFKIGDKVRLKDPQYWGGGMEEMKIGIVVGFDTYIRVTWDDKSSIYRNYPHLLREIEYIVKVGEQLVFNFMNS